MSQYLQCYKPTVTVEATLENSTEIQALTERELNESYAVISEVLSDACLLHSNGFWNYRFCFGQNVTQFSLAEGKVDLHYVLGQYSEDGQSVQLLHKTAGYYVSENMGRGDYCAAANMARKLEIQYVCYPGIDEVKVVRVRETVLCRYIIEVAVPQLCQFDLLSTGERQATVHSIICSRGDSIHEINPVSNVNPVFLGSGFYLLRQRCDSSITSSKNGFAPKLMYADAMPLADDAEINFQQEVFFERAAYAFKEIISNELLQNTTFGPQMVEDSLLWLSEVVDLKGQRICFLRFKVNNQGVVSISLQQDDIYGELAENSGTSPEPVQQDINSGTTVGDKPAKLQAAGSEAMVEQNENLATELATFLERLRRENLDIESKVSIELLDVDKTEDQVVFVVSLKPDDEKNNDSPQGLRYNAKADNEGNNFEAPQLNNKEVVDEGQLDHDEL